MKHQNKQIINLSGDGRLTIKPDVNFCHFAGPGVKDAGLQKYS